MFSGSSQVGLPNKIYLPNASIMKRDVPGFCETNLVALTLNFIIWLYPYMTLKFGGLFTSFTYRNKETESVL